MAVALASLSPLPWSSPWALAFVVCVSIIIIMIIVFGVVGFSVSLRSLLDIVRHETWDYAVYRFALPSLCHVSVFISIVSVHFRQRCQMPGGATAMWLRALLTSRSLGMAG